MNPDYIDPSLCSGERTLDSLDDGFSPRPAMNAATTPTHPVEPDPEDSQSDDAAANPTQLPIQPEFGPMLEPVEPDEPGVKPTHL